MTESVGASRARGPAIGRAAKRASETSRKPRRTQAMRTSETRMKLIEATLDILLKDGYARATTADIADLAGVSRGALTHHFESKDDLVADALEHLLKSATQDIAVLSEKVAQGHLNLEVFLEKLWELFSGRLFLVTLEYVTEARHNAWLHAKVVPLVREFHAALDQIWRSFFEDSGLTSAEASATLNATLCLLRGMGVQTVLRDDPAYYRGLLDLWKKLVLQSLERAGAHR